MRHKELGVVKYTGNKIKEEKGEMLVFAMVFIIVICLVVCGVIEYLRLNLVISKLKEEVNRSVVTCAINNSYAAFGGIREGNSGVYEQNTAGIWEQAVSTQDLTVKLVRELDMVQEHNNLVKYNKATGAISYKIEDISVEIINPEQAAIKGAEIRFETKYTVTISLSLFNKIVEPISVSCIETAKWKPIF